MQIWILNCCKRDAKLHFQNESCTWTCESKYLTRRLANIWDGAQIFVSASQLFSNRRKLSRDGLDWGKNNIWFANIFQMFPNMSQHRTASIYQLSQYLDSTYILCLNSVDLRETILSSLGKPPLKKNGNRSIIVGQCPLWAIFTYIFVHIFVCLCLCICVFVFVYLCVDCGLYICVLYLCVHMCLHICVLTVDYTRRISRLLL